MQWGCNSGAECLLSSVLYISAMSEFGCMKSWVQFPTSPFLFVPLNALFFGVLDRFLSPGYVRESKKSLGFTLWKGWIGLSPVCNPKYWQILGLHSFIPHCAARLLLPALPPWPPVHSLTCVRTLTMSILKIYPQIRPVTLCKHQRRIRRGTGKALRWKVCSGPSNSKVCVLGARLMTDK